MLTCALHFAKSEQLATAREGIHETEGRIFATLTVKVAGEPRGVDLYFSRVEQIETFVVALQKLGNELAGALPEVPWPDEPPPGGVQADTTLTEEEINLRHDKLRGLGLMAPVTPITEADEIPLAVSEAGECRGCKRAVEPGADLCVDCAAVAAEIEF